MAMFGHNYYHGTIRRYIIMFGNIFNDLTVERYDSSGNRIQTIQVPIAYGPKQRFIERVLRDQNFDNPVSTVLPRLGFEMNGISYAPQRKLNSAHKMVRGVDTGGTDFDFVYTPVPYDMNFSLSALVRNAEDGSQIVEQIVPFFTPDWTVTMKLLPELSVNMDIPIELTGVSQSDEYEGNFDSRRVITWQFDFTIKGYLFGPLQKYKYINQSNVYSIDDSATVNKAIIELQTFTGDADFEYTTSIDSNTSWTST